MTALGDNKGKLPHPVTCDPQSFSLAPPPPPRPQPQGNWTAIVWLYCNPESSVENLLLSLSYTKRFLQLWVSWVGVLETQCAFFLAQTVSSSKQPRTALLSPLNRRRRRKALTRGFVQRWDWCYHSLSICAAEEVTLSVFLTLEPGLFHMLLQHKFLWKRRHTSVNILPGRDENSNNPQEKSYCCDSYLSMGFSCHKWWTILINFLCH